MATSPQHQHHYHYLSFSFHSFRSTVPCWSISPMVIALLMWIASVCDVNQSPLFNSCDVVTWCERRDKVRTRHTDTGGETATHPRCPIT